MRKVWMLIRVFREEDISAYAAAATFFLMLSVFPALGLLLGILRYTQLQPADLMDLLGDFLPEALQIQVWDLIRDAYANTSRLVLSVSAVTALWSAGKGIHGLMRGLNRIYGISSRRSWFRTRIMCAVYMVFFLAVLMLTLVLHVFGGTLIRFQMVHGAPGMFWAGLEKMRVVLLVGLQTGIFCLMMMYLPDENRSLRGSLPGALMASAGWMGVSKVFSLYVEGSSKYSITFGSVYGVALGMLWVYACVMTVFLGAAVNRILWDG